MVKPIGKTGTVVVLGGLFSFFITCAPSTLMSVWHDPSLHQPKLGKMLVVAVRKDAVKRRIWEDAFAGQLKLHGVTAISSYTLFPDTLPDSGRINAAVQGSGFDGILAILRLPNETTTEVVQGYTTTEQNVRYSTYWERYMTYYTEIDHPGFIDSQTVAVRAIDIATTGKGGHMIWSAISRTPDPRNVTDLQSGVAGLVTDNLAKQGIIGSKK
jgi:hypothetical protein